MLRSELFLHMRLGVKLKPVFLWDPVWPTLTGLIKNLGKSRKTCSL